MTDWLLYCRKADGVAVEDGRVVVELAEGRRQRVVVDETADTIEFASVVAKRAVVEGMEDATFRVWRRNRSTELVGFRIDERGRLVAEAWAPKAGLSAEEFLVHLRRIASEADLFEHQLTGADRE